MFEVDPESVVQDAASLCVLTADVTQRLTEAGLRAGLSPDEVGQAIVAGVEIAAMIALRAQRVLETGAPDDVRLIADWLVMDGQHIADACDAQGVPPYAILSGMEDGTYALAAAMVERYPEG